MDHPPWSSKLRLKLKGPDVWNSKVLTSLMSIHLGVPREGGAHKAHNPPALLARLAAFSEERLGWLTVVVLAIVHFQTTPQTTTWCHATQAGHWGRKTRSELQPLLLPYASCELRCYSRLRGKVPASARLRLEAQLQSRCAENFTKTTKRWMHVWLEYSLWCAARPKLVVAMPFLTLVSGAFAVVFAVLQHQVVASRPCFGCQCKVFLMQDL